MPASQQRTSQRIFEFGLSNEGSTRELGWTFLNRTGKQNQFISLGGPRLRTNWQIQTVNLEMGVRFNWFKAQTVGNETQIAVRVLYDSMPVAVTILKGKIGEPGTTKEGVNNTFIELPRRAYILEMYAPLTIPGGHQLSIEFEMKGVLVNEFQSVTTTLLEPKLTVVFAQDYMGGGGRAI